MPNKPKHVGRPASADGRSLRAPTAIEALPLLAVRRSLRATRHRRSPIVITRTGIPVVVKRLYQSNEEGSYAKHKEQP